MTKIRDYYRSDIGRQRENNEDAVGGRAPRNAREARQSGWLYVVADGMGGHQFGERASQHVLQTLLEGYYAMPDVPPPERLRRLIEQANTEIYQEARRILGERQHMGTTVVAAAIHQDTLYLAHVGDSRAYLIRGERIHRLTRDHSVVEEMVRSGVMTPQEARTSKLRNRLTRSVGTRPKVEVELSPPISLQPGDLILLCSDGLTQYANDEDILTAAYGAPQDIVERLIAFANAHGGSDNVTVVAIRYDKAPVLAAVPPVARAALAMGVVGVLLAAGLALAAQMGWGPLARRTAPASPTVGLTPLPSATLPLAPGALPARTSSPSPSPTSTASPTPTATLPSPTPSPTVTPSPELTSGLPILCLYTVQAGDTAQTIAQRFGITKERVQDALQGKAPSSAIGETLQISGITAERCRQGGGIVATLTPTPHVPSSPTPLLTPSVIPSPHPTASMTPGPTPTASPPPATLTPTVSPSPATLTPTPSATSEKAFLLSVAGVGQQFSIRGGES